MDASEATKIVMSRIQSLDPENASKIMGYILIQEPGEKEMIRLAFSPDTLLFSYINKAKARFALASSTRFRSSLPRIAIPNNGFNLSNARGIDNVHTPSPHFYKENEFLSGGGVNYEQQFEEELQFADESGCLDPIMSPGGRSDLFPYGDHAVSPHPFHRRSYSVNDAAFMANIEEGGRGNGFLWRPCMYFARGYCKNGSSCKFLHGENGGCEGADEGSPSGGGGFDELMKMKAFQQQRLAFLASGAHNPFAYNKCMDENQRDDLSPMGLSACASSTARQIYLTFPADSMFKEEDVSNYFSIFGPVQDVRIPYQQKRMFGFVTFVYPETVRLILGKGNPHFVCDSRVLVKPYKEKGKVREKKHHQLEIDSREHFDHPFGPRMLLSPQEMMLRKKLEQEVELQQAIEFESQRMLRLQLRHSHNNQYLQRFPSVNPYSSPRSSQLLISPRVNASSHSINEDNLEEAAIAEEKKVLEGDESSSNNNIHGGDQLHGSNSHELNLNEGRDDFLASAMKSVAENLSAEANNTSLLPDSSSLNLASLKSCYLQMPRFSSGQEAIEM